MFKWHVESDALYETILTFIQILHGPRDTWHIQYKNKISYWINALPILQILTKTSFKYNFKAF